MSRYCEVLDVGLRLGLNNAQRQQATTKIESNIRRASIEIDQEFNYYGRTTPSSAIQETTLNGAVSVGATTITLTDASSFSSAGKGDIDGDSFKWTGKSSNDLTGVTGVSFDHLTGVKVREGEMAHVLREICADISTALYLEDESTFQTSDEGLRASALRERAIHQLRRLAHLGKVI